MAASRGARAHCSLYRHDDAAQNAKKKNLNASRPSEQFLLTLAFSVLVANPKKLLYAATNPGCGLLKRESLAAHPSPPLRTLLVRRK